MIVGTDGATLGTVGGGLFEARTLALAETALDRRHSAHLAMRLTSSEAADRGMICGGRMETLLEYLDTSDPSYPALLDKLLTSAAAGPHALVRSIETEENVEGADRNDETRTWVRTCWGLLTKTGLEGDVPGFIESLGAEAASCLHRKDPLLTPDDAVRYFVHPIAEPEHVLIVGAGHVGQALAQICPTVGFATIVIDDRDDFANRNRFPSAADILVRESLEDCFRGLAITKESYIVIVTRGHVFDRTVLAQSLRTGAGYIGMIGSRTKRDLTYRALLDEGFRQEDLGRVHSPIGLAIGAKTPEEIAISILAELIDVRSKRKS